jgi:N-acetyl sugar amidotransferase
MSIKRCRICLTVNLRPDTEFQDGACSACIAHSRRSEIDWRARREDLIKLIESAKVSPEGYHCIIPSSGGKDSSYQLLTALELGARPLVVTATTCMPTEIGEANIRNLARYADTLEVTPNRRIRATLNRLTSELVWDSSWAEHVAIFHIPWRVAAEKQVGLILYGECPQNAYGGPMGTLDARQMTRQWVAEFGGHLGLRPADLVGMAGIRREDMAIYQMPPEDRIAGIEAHFLGAYIPWNSHRNANVAVKAGMTVPPEPPSKANYFSAENLDNAQTGLHDWMGYTKYGYGRACAQISIDIRYGLISREEAITIVRSIDGLFPEYYMGTHYTEILEHIGLPEPRFWELARQYANKALFDVSGERPVMKPEVWEASFE